MTFRVTAYDIRRGRPLWIRGCPVARALSRTTRHQWTARYETLDDTKTGFEIATPARVRKWMNDFDSGRPVAPFTFSLRLPK